MLPCFVEDSGQTSIGITPLTRDSLPAWLAQQPAMVQQWVQANNFTAKAETLCLIPNSEGKMVQVLLGIEQPHHFWSFGFLPTHLPLGCYHLDPNDTLFATPQQWQRALLAWGLGSYSIKYKHRPNNTDMPQLLLLNSPATELVQQWVKSIYWVRDLINTPCEEMGPEELATAVQELGQEFGASVNICVGDQLLVDNYPIIHAVGRAAAREPRLIDLRWGQADAVKVTLVGKGVCFDTGGLNLKSGAGMRLMKKDMGGAAQVLGLARMIMQQQLPVCLRVLIPAVENAVSGASYRPGDVFNTRAGIRVEITNTDAEGRLVLCDALTAAIEDQPDILIDIATLTGAARVAVGPELAAYFTNNEAMAQALEHAAHEELDPIWRLPLHHGYKRFLKSEIADCCNSASTDHAGAITAALYLEQFVPQQIPWAHFDLMAWNEHVLAGRPVGGEAMAIRALFEYLSAAVVRVRA